MEASDQAPDDADLGGRDALGDDRERGLLQGIEDELKLLPVVHRQPADPGADVRLELDQPVRLELEKGLANRRLRGRGRDVYMNA